MPRKPENSSQDMSRRLEMDAFAAKKGEVQNRDLPFEQEHPGSAEDAAERDEAFRQMMVEPADKLLAGEVNELMKRIKQDDDRSHEVRSHDLSVTNPLAAEVEGLLDLVDTKLDEIKKAPEADNAAFRESYLNKIRKQLEEKFDRFALEDKFRQDYVAEQRKTRTAEKQAAFRKEISQPSVIVKPERLAPPPEMPEPAEEDAEPPIYEMVDGKYVNINDLKKPKPQSLWDRAKKKLGIK